MIKIILRPTCLVLALLLALAAAIVPDSQLTLAENPDKYPATVEITSNEGTIEHLTYSDTLIEAIDEAGISLGENDELSLPDDLTLLPGEKYQVTLIHYDQVQLIWGGFALDTAGEFDSMSELMSRSGYSDLDLSDGSRIEKSQTLVSSSQEMALNYVSVDKKSVRKYETIPFTTITIDDDSMLVGQSEVKVQGEEGQRALIFEETYENGIFIESVQTGSEIVKEPVQKVIHKGTRRYPVINYSTLTSTVLKSFSKIKSLLVNNGNKNYRSFKDNNDGTITVDGKTYKYLSMKKRTITMYDGLECCLQKGCHNPPINHNTFSGVPAQRGLVATYGIKVNGRYVYSVLPMGSIIFVEGYGLGVVADINGAKNNPDLIDVCYNAGEFRAGTATLGKINSRVYVISKP